MCLVRWTELVFRGLAFREWSPRQWLRSHASFYAGLGPTLRDLWKWLQLMWLQFEVVRGPVGVRLGVDVGPDWGPLGPKLAPHRPQTTPTAPRTASDCSHMSCNHVHRSPTVKKLSRLEGRLKDGRPRVRLSGKNGGRSVTDIKL